MRRVIYLSGTIANLTYDEATAKRNEATQLLVDRGWDVLDPMRGKEILSTLAVIDESTAKELLGGVTDAAIVQRDYDDVRRADAIIVLSGDKPSWGTAFEWAMAHFLFAKPVVVVASKGNPTRDHPWCKSMSSYFAETVEEAIDFIDKWLDRGYKLEKKDTPHLELDNVFLQRGKEARNGVVRVNGIDYLEVGEFDRETQTALHDVSLEIENSTISFQNVEAERAA